MRTRSNAVVLPVVAVTGAGNVLRNTPIPLPGRVIRYLVADVADYSTKVFRKEKKRKKAAFRTRIEEKVLKSIGNGNWQQGGKNERKNY